jgi:capsular exopolysaccharide synthesis family protein
MSREYAKMAERFEPGYPEIQRVKTELESARKSLLNETQNLIKGAYSDWRAAFQKEKSLEEVFNNQKQQAIQLNSNSILYNSLRIEIENKQNLMEALLKRQSETDVSAQLTGLGTANVRIVDRAEPPLYPSSPKKKLNVALALLLGLFGGTGLAFLIEHLDDSIKTFDDVEKYSGLPSLGVVPAFSPDGFPAGHGYGYGKRQTGYERGVKIKVEKGRRRKADVNSWLDNGVAGSGGVASDSSRVSGAPPKRAASIELITFKFPASGYSECYRTIRSSLLLSSAVPRPKCIGVSSPLPQEGKTSTLSNLAVTLAQNNKKVQIVDSDLRKPRQHKIFKMINVAGLSNFLADTVDLASLIKPTEVPNLFLLNAGTIPPNPIELLDTERMRRLIGLLKGSFDYVLFDTPPLLAVTDGLILGAELDGMILVIWGEKTSRESLKLAKDKLVMANIKALGVIVNNLVIRKGDYYYRQQYLQYYGKEGLGSYRVQTGVFPQASPPKKEEPINPPRDRN